MGPDRTRRRRGRSFAVTAAVTLVVMTTTWTLAGCAAHNDSTAPPAGAPDTSAEVSYTVNYGSFGTTATIDCAKGKSLNVGGSNNTLTVTGRLDDRPGARFVLRLPAAEASPGEGR